MDWMVFWDNVKGNLYWIIPSVTSLFFALVTTILIFFQNHWQRQEKIRNAEHFVQQNKLQQTQISIELFEKRLEIYNGILKSLSNVANKNTVEGNDLIEFLQNTRGLKFLFGSHVKEYREEIYDTFNKIILVESHIASNEAKTNQEYNEKLQNEKFELMNNIIKFTEESDVIFLEYFNFQNSNLQFAANETSNDK